VPTSAPEPVANNDALVAWLIVKAGPNPGRDYRLPPSSLIVGSGSDCGILLTADQYVSSRHMEITGADGKFVLQDLDSTNGTFVNDERVTRCELHDGDQVRIGMTQFVFKSLQA